MAFTKEPALSRGKPAGPPSNLVHQIQRDLTGDRLHMKAADGGIVGQLDHKGGTPSGQQGLRSRNSLSPDHHLPLFISGLHYN